MKALFSLLLKTGDIVEKKLPARFEVCPRCRGEGLHVNPNVDGHGITAEEWENEWDDDRREAYMSGRYDITCQECEGKRVISVLDDTRISKRMFMRHFRYLEMKTEQDREDRTTLYWETGGAEGSRY